MYTGVHLGLDGATGAHRWDTASALPERHPTLPTDGVSDAVAGVCGSTFNDRPTHAPLG